jgi:hypothetical protein
MQEQEEHKKMEEMVAIQEDLEAVQRFTALEKQRQAQVARRKLINEEV